MDNEIDESTIEQTHLKIQTDTNGNLISKNQVMDYWYHADSLLQMNFHEFAWCIALENKNKVRISNLDNAQLGTLTRHSLHADHPLAETHHSVEHTNEEHGDCNTRLIPRVIGSFIPRKNTGRVWKLFALAHFKLFGPSNPFVMSGSCIDDTYDKFAFSEQSKYVMNNWEDTHACEDQQDAERLRKRVALIVESFVMTKTLNRSLCDLEIDDIDVLPGKKTSAEQDFV